MVWRPMRRVRGRALVGVWAIALTALPATAQQGTINPRIPPPPPPPEDQPALAPTTLEPAASGKNIRDVEVPPPSLPASVAIPAGTRIAVVLETPLSTRIARRGQLVTFRTSEALRVHEQIEIPPETGFTGTVVEVKRPGHFGKVGALRVKVDRINLSTGTTAEVAARLDSPDMKGHERLSSDNSRGTDLYRLATYTLEGTLLGSQISGGKGAAVGAAAGAAVAVMILMSRRGPDLYLEPGMPFQVILDRAVELPGADVFAAQQGYAHSRGNHDGPEGADSSEIQRNPDGAVLDADRPKLKRRPKSPQP
jgi:hypothetical protein